MRFWGRKTLPSISGVQLTDAMVRELLDYHRRLTVMLDGALEFWVGGVDWERGGFFGKIDYDGRPVVGAEKHLVQQARHLWTFSNVYRLHQGLPEIARICHHQFRFTKQRLFIPGEHDFHTVVSATGQSLRRGTHHYLLAFAIFGLSSYALAFPKDPAGAEALGMAKGVLARIVRESHHPAYGFDERVYPSRWCRHDKEINTQMHLLEALTELYEAAALHGDPESQSIRETLRQQLEHVCFRGIARLGRRYCCFRGYRHDWKVTSRKEIDYGHDIEVVHLVMSAAKALGREGESRLKKRVVQLGRSVTGDAYDPSHGKWFYSGSPKSGQVLERVSNFWTNFEALNGLFELWELTNEPHFLEKFGSVLTWLETRQINSRTREWYYNVDDAGNPVDLDVFGNPCGWMTFEWKSSYHSVRALLSRKLRIQQILGAAGHTPGGTPDSRSPPEARTP